MITIVSGIIMLGILVFVHELGHFCVAKLAGVKVDGSFVARMQDSDPDRATVEAVVRMSEGLGVTATAEAVESREQYETLRDLGCDLGQGSFFADPFPATALEARLSAS